MTLDECIARLRQYHAFGDTISPSAVQFEYASATDDQLTQLRSNYGIQPACEDADVLQQALDSMSWVFSRFQLTGSSVDIPATNALDILARSDEGTFYCSHKAVVLNEVLLARGLHSRVITCIPQHFDMDRHVAVIVFLAAQRKWVFLDPTFSTHFHDGSTGALGPIEIREAYRGGHCPGFSEIPINKTWRLVLDGQEYDSYHDWYTTYMAKNCFRFSCPAVSGFGNYGSSETQMVFLNPTGYSETNEYDDVSVRSKPSAYTHSLAEFLRPPM
jgi:hypothetical protein